MLKGFPWKKKRGSFGGSLSLHIFIYMEHEHKQTPTNQRTPLSLTHITQNRIFLKKLISCRKSAFSTRNEAPKRDRKSICLDHSLSLSQTFFFFVVVFLFFFGLIIGPTSGVLLVQCLYQLLSPQGTMEWQPQYTLICSRFRFL